MAEPGDGSRPVSVAPTEEDDFDLNAEELPEEDQTPAASGVEPEESFETEDEDLPEDVSYLAYYLSFDPADLQAVFIAQVGIELALQLPLQGRQSSGVL